MDNYVQVGDIIDDTVVGTVTSGVPVALHSMVGIPVIDGVDGQVIPMRIKGVCLLPLKAGGADADVLTGKPLHFNQNDGFFGGAASVVPGDINNAGISVDDHGKAADPFINILLTPGAGVEVVA